MARHSFLDTSPFQTGDGELIGIHPADVPLRNPLPESALAIWLGAESITGFVGNCLVGRWRNASPMPTTCCALRIRLQRGGAP
jgi:hypothetical protein